MPQASDLRQNVRFERREQKDDGMGNTVDEWKAFGDKRRAKLLPTSVGGGQAPMRANETVLAQRITGTAMWDLIVYSDDLTRQITTDDRAIQILKDGSDGLKYNIRFIGDMYGNDRWLLMQLQEGVADG